MPANNSAKARHGRDAQIASRLFFLYVSRWLLYENGSPPSSSRARLWRARWHSNHARQFPGRVGAPGEQRCSGGARAYGIIMARRGNRLPTGLEGVAEYEK